MVESAVLNLMIEQGGAFNRKLAELHYVADLENTKKLELAFSDIFEHFQKLLPETSPDEN
jgi:hypothetical protein